ncbi:MAG: tRNA threonylcarbamoyl adenosine modification protein, Sua5/YciO/YrdC/YwlC family [Phormidesmis priestleyi Ana]|uniref:tRNA threonylcarbamoyl adenosine modification protein, Sua5/YciO/YrdC/YwlC family n=1 Tax=Phormidesmis priestleyi Ana TaxID=1666911 RepID=A0A0N8KNC3_9CYAN|nr:MAG: tRNA threonylcarbamoyl adenosine modification protein, Sua5/YciO/YrdC/YwlC family [Phormidesmis priestleyi Ana]
MAKIYNIHPTTPQTREIEALIEDLRRGAVMLYPTDTVYAIGCDLNAKKAIEKVRQLKQIANDKPLTFLCYSLSNIASYAHVSDPAYRIIKHLIPGPYTFLLPATKAVPRLVLNPKRRTTGIRVPKSPICNALLESLGNPVISTSALSVVRNSTEDDIEALSKADLFDRMDKQVDVILDSDTELRYQVSTILDLTGNSPVVTRKGLGWQEAIEWGAELDD